MTTEAATPDITIEPAATETKPAAETQAAKTEPDKGKQEPIKYEETGDAKLDLALDFFGRNGLDADHPAIQAAVNGDFGLLEAFLDEKGAAGWKSYVALAKEAHANAMEKTKDADAKITDAVAKSLEQYGYTTEQWGEVIQWIRTESPEDVPEINKILASGPLGARAITAFILTNHREATGTEYKPQASAVKEESGANAAAARQELSPITKSEFAREAEKLARSFGPDYMSSKEYRTLRQRAGYQNR